MTICQPCGVVLPHRAWVAVRTDSPWRNWWPQSLPYGTNTRRSAAGLLASGLLKGNGTRRGTRGPGYAVTASVLSPSDR
jgi:hypothetical protein